jgi:hypothetical protein
MAAAQDARARAAGGKRAWLEAQAATGQASGQSGVVPSQVKQALKDAGAELTSENEVLTEAEDGENAFSEIFGTRLSDLPGVSKLAGGFADGSMLRTMADLPVVDVAGGFATVLNAQRHIAHGVPPWLAYPLETGVTVASIAAGTVVAGVVGGAVAGLPVPGAPVLGAAAGVAAAGVAGYGVGGYLHNYIEDFGAQWHQHGVLGIVTDLGAAGVGTWDDTKQLAAGVGHADGGVWHGIRSLL